VTRPPLFTDDEIAVVRRAYARQITALAGAAEDARLEAAFAAVPRERFLPADLPWRTVAPVSGGYRTLPAEPVIAYQDVVLALAPERGVNNGQPSLHARWLHHARPRGGERIVHIGAGAGYYTAILAELVGSNGHVLGVEVDPALAERATENLAQYSNAEVVTGDGTGWPRDPVDVVYVNASVERPAGSWLERLKPGGQLVFPLGVPRPRPSSSGGTHAQYGAGLLVERRGDGFAARWLGPALFVCAEGEGLTATEEDRTALKIAFEGGGIEFVRSLRWRVPPAADRSWFIGQGWSLCYDEAMA
jgi:protein-L-isoaspartate(D-aspartate) O-methyltransferase